ncbi:hypothetical protein CFI00_03090 [Nocardioides sp. S5]|uniref:hypothetical protein n=1 Tax=Nocardioides sp. S5 TaxID=2017486 RepID=UPI001A8C9FFA|nr:hypothetical protein [Nocardioides sp. S5]QSR29506.1 hypothetical protein CFI00_03090 [Nocardioides sp. S5]
MMTVHRAWRPQPLWTPAGLLLGTACGALVGLVVMTAWTALDGFDGVGALGAYAAVVGGFVGGATGLVVGAVMTFLVGSHLPHEEARDRAAVVGTLATTFVLALALTPLWPAYVLGAPALVVGMLCAGPLCLWLAATPPFRSDVG